MKLITFSLWGNSDMYNNGAIQNCILAEQLFPDWICRFYIGTNTDKKTIEILKSFKNTQVVDMGIEATPKSRIWRFYPCSEQNVEMMISRDADCRFSPREVEAVNGWLNSNKNFHIIRDHPHHNAPILAGLWGARNGILKNMKELLLQFENNNIADKKEYDQIFLANLVYGIVKNDTYVNDEFFERTNKLQTPRNPNGVYFLGEIFNGDGSFYSQEHRDLIRN